MNSTVRINKFSSKPMAFHVFLCSPGAFSYRQVQAVGGPLLRLREGHGPAVHAIALAWVLRLETRRVGDQRFISRPIKGPKWFEDVETCGKETHRMRSNAHFLYISWISRGGLVEARGAPSIWWQKHVYALQFFPRNRSNDQQLAMSNVLPEEMPPFLWLHHLHHPLNFWSIPSNSHVTEAV